MADFEARQALMGLIVRVVDEVRFGLRELDLDEIRCLASTWSFLNDGVTPSEIALRMLRDQQ
jgi:hypothetical protein